MASYSRLLQHLVQLGLVDEGDVRTAAARQKETGGDILDVLLETGLVHEQELAGALASFYRVPQVNLTRVRVTKQALRQATGEFCRHHQVLPFGVDHQTGELMVAVGNPAQVSAIDALRFRHGQNVRMYVAPRSQLREAIEFYYFSDHSDSRPITGPQQRSGLHQRPRSSPTVSGLLQRPTTLPGDPETDSSTSGLEPFRKPVSREYYTHAEEPAPRGQGPGTEDLGAVSPLPTEPSGELFGRTRRSLATARRPAAARRSDSAISGLDLQNPYAEGSDGEIEGDMAARLERLEATIKRLEQALRYEMTVSRALAEILVENGLISSEQLKSRMRED